MRDACNVLTSNKPYGILGVNLIYAAFYEVQIQKSFLEGWHKARCRERIEIDYVDLRGRHLKDWDRRALLVQWYVRDSQRRIFLLQGRRRFPLSEVLYKKAVVLHRDILAHGCGSLAVHARLLASVFRELQKELAKQTLSPLVFFA